MTALHWQPFHRRRINAIGHCGRREVHIVMTFW